MRDPRLLLSDPETEFQRVPVTTGLRLLDGNVRVRTGDIVRIAGPSLIGKTQLLYALVAAAIAPSPAGRGVRVVYFEMSENLNRTRIAALVQDRMNIFKKLHPGRDVGCIDDAMRRIEVYRTYSIMQLAVTMKEIESYLATREGSNGTLQYFCNGLL